MMFTYELNGLQEKHLVENICRQVLFLTDGEEGMLV